LNWSWCIFRAPNWWSYNDHLQNFAWCCSAAAFVPPSYRLRVKEIQSVWDWYSLPVMSHGRALYILLFVVNMSFYNMVFLWHCQYECSIIILPFVNMMYCIWVCLPYLNCACPLFISEDTTLYFYQTSMTVTLPRLEVGDLIFYFCLTLCITIWTAKKEQNFQISDTELLSPPAVKELLQFLQMH
jgi:hypothetical protein